MDKQTEKESNYDHLEKMSTRDLIENMNKEDQTVPQAIAMVFDNIEVLIDAAAIKLKDGGRLFYIGAGTSGRLGIVDASECPPTFGVPHGLVVGLMAGGDKAMRKAVEFAEDDEALGWKDLKEHLVDEKDFVVGIAASGTTPYVVGALKRCRAMGIQTGSISCNLNTPLSEEADFPIEVIVGPEFVTGSTRMKAGTAQKLVLNMISTSLMIKLGRVEGNRMVDMQLSNNKLLDRGTRMIMKATGLDYEESRAMLDKCGSVRNAIREAS